MTRARARATAPPPYPASPPVAVRVDWRDEAAVESLMEAMKGVYSPDLLQAKYATTDAEDAARNPTKGQCAAAAEALWHMIGGASSPYLDHWAYDAPPARARQAAGVARAPEDETHHWLQRVGLPAGSPPRRYDPTADQYLHQVEADGRILSEPPPYDWGVAAGYQSPSKTPSARAQAIIDRTAVLLQRFPLDGVTVDPALVRDPQANPARPFQAARYADQGGFYRARTGWTKTGWAEPEEAAAAATQPKRRVRA